MNAFANTLFSLLLGWVKGLFQSVFQMVQDGGAGSFFVWLGDHWLGLVIVICLLGALADMLIWLLRWRPDLVWRTKWRRLTGRLSGREMNERDERAFYSGYQEAVELPADAWDAPVGDDAAYAPAAGEEEIWWQEPVYETPADAMDMQPAAGTAQVRRRRSDKYQKTDRLKALSRIKDRIRDAQEDENTMLDGLPPVMDHKEAFYDPVFPDQEKNTR